MAQQSIKNLQSAIYSLREGNFVLVHDSGKREDEVDMVIASQFITAQHISTMRNQAGGLICVCVEDQIAKNIGLQYAHDTLFTSNSFDPSLKQMIYGITPYGDHPTFSMWINHKNTRTGITDFDRALTIKETALICDKPAHLQKESFVSSFKTPGHVPLLVAKEGLLKKRRGHTEISVFLAKIARLTQCTAICEMIDSESHTALSVEKAQQYATKNKIQFLDLTEILEWSY